MLGLVVSVSFDNTQKNQNLMRIEPVFVMDIDKVYKYYTNMRFIVT